MTGLSAQVDLQTYKKSYDDRSASPSAPSDILVMEYFVLMKLLRLLRLLRLLMHLRQCFFPQVQLRVAESQA